MEAEARNRVRDISLTAAYKQSQQARKRIEHIFAEAKNWHGLARARGRGFKAVSQQVCLTGFVLTRSYNRYFTNGNTGQCSIS